MVDKKKIAKRIILVTLVVGLAILFKVLGLETVFHSRLRQGISGEVGCRLCRSPASGDRRIHGGLYPRDIVIFYPALRL